MKHLFKLLFGIVFLILGAAYIYASEAIEQLTTEMSKAQAQTAPATISELQKEGREELEREKRRLEPEYEWLVTGKEEEPTKTESFTKAEISKEDVVRYKAEQKLAEEFADQISDQISQINGLIFGSLRTAINPFFIDNKGRIYSTFLYNLTQWAKAEADSRTLSLYKIISSQLKSSKSRQAQLAALSLDKTMDYMKGIIKNPATFKTTVQLNWELFKMFPPQDTKGLMTQENETTLAQILAGTYQGKGTPPRTVNFKGISVTLPARAFYEFSEIQKMVEEQK